MLHLTAEDLGHRVQVKDLDRLDKRDLVLSGHCERRQR